MRRGRLFYKGRLSAAQRYLREDSPTLRLDDAGLDDPRQVRLFDVPRETCECAHARGAHVQGSGACTATRACDCAAYREASHE